jgi:hypothetical protein
MSPLNPLTPMRPKKDEIKNENKQENPCPCWGGCMLELKEVRSLFRFSI